MFDNIIAETDAAITEFLKITELKPGSLVVIGCSSSEIMGGSIGKASVPEAGEAVYKAIAKITGETGIFLAAQCCEHLNRALVIEREVLSRFGYEEVFAVPAPKAGGAFASAAYRSMSDPVLAEYIKADAGLDIGATMIGMHLKPVAVPLRLSVKAIGHASVAAARTRPKLIGGERAVYIL